VLLSFVSVFLLLSLVCCCSSALVCLLLLQLLPAFACFCLLSVVGCCCLLSYLLFLSYAVVVPVVLLSNAVFVASIISCYCMAFALLFGSCSRCVCKKDIVTVSHGIFCCHSLHSKVSIIIHCLSFIASQMIKKYI